MTESERNAANALAALLALANTNEFCERIEHIVREFEAGNEAPPEAMWQICRWYHRLLESNRKLSMTAEAPTQFLRKLPGGNIPNSYRHIQD